MASVRVTSDVTWIPKSVRSLQKSFLFSFSKTQFIIILGEGALLPVVTYLNV